MPRRVIAVLDIVEGETVADIGAGTGCCTMRLAERAPAGAIARARRIVSEEPSRALRAGL